MPKAFSKEDKKKKGANPEKMAAFLAVLEKIYKKFPNTVANRNRRIWTHCPICKCRLDMYREPTKGHLRAKCATPGCFEAME